MSRLDRMFASLAQRGEGAFGAFLMLGDPDLVTSARMLEAAVRGGADMLEVGIPFSDPVADGPVIQRAASRALAQGVRPADCWTLIAGLRDAQPDVPIGVLTYANLLAARGPAAFCRDAAEAGADSLLVADIPSIEADPFAAEARAAGLDWVMIAAPNSGDSTVRTIARLARGYTYCVARPGVTGADSTLRLDHDAVFERLRDAGAPPPILGFGIATPAHVEEAVASGAAGVISGSAIVALAEAGDSPVEAVEAFVRTMKAKTRKPR